MDDSIKAKLKNIAKQNRTRPLRIEFKGAVYHITSRGNTRQAIFFLDIKKIEWGK